jgi:hypothetical protein
LGGRAVFGGFCFRKGARGGIWQSGVGLANLGDGPFDQLNNVDKYDECYNDQATELDHLPLKKV